MRKISFVDIAGRAHAKKRYKQIIHKHGSQIYI
jgi:hypothetical protein